jgi:hypothetical protein
MSVQVWQQVDAVEMRGGVATGEPRRVVVQARTLTGMPVEVVIQEDAMRKLGYELFIVASAWNEEIPALTAGE